MTSTQTKRQALHEDQTGIGSLLFTLVMMIVISLIVLGFAQLARRGQRESLDNQLSKQAYYAAESGVNDVVYKLNHNPTLQTGDDKSCTQFSQNNGLMPSGATEGVIDASNNVVYTCVLVNSNSLPNLEYKKITPDSSEVIPINPDSAGSLSALTLQWSPNLQDASVDTTANARSNCGNSSDTSLPTTGNYNCDFAMLRLDLVPKSSISRNGLQTSDMTIFIKPVDMNPNAGGLNYNPSANRVQLAGCTDDIPSGNVTAASVCKFTINVPSQSYLMHISSVYSSVPDLFVIPTGANLYGAQAIVDVTGRAQDVLKRLQVRVPLGDSTLPVTGAIVSNSAICKKFVGGGSGGLAIPYTDQASVSNPDCTTIP